jgi:MFS superfamily sulfate permease-like transporter
VHTSPPTPGTLSEPGLVVYRFGVGLFYANAGRLAEEALGLVDVPDPPRWFVLDAAAMDDIDYTGGKTLAELADELRERNIVFAIADANTAVRRELDRFGVTDKIGSQHYYDGLRAAREAFHAGVSGKGVDGSRHDQAEERERDG